MMPGSKGYYLVSEPTNTGLVTNTTLYSNTPVIPNIQSCALYIGSNYLQISKGGITAIDNTIRIDLADSSKKAINNAYNCSLQYTSTISTTTGGWVNLGRLQTHILGVHMKIEILFSEGDAITGSLPAQDSMYNGNMLIAHFITSHISTISQPAFDNSPFYANCT